MNCHHLGGLNTPLPSVPSRWADPLNPIFFLGRWRWVCAGETIGSADTPWRGFSCLLGTRSRDTIWTRQIDPLTAAFPSPKTVSPHRALQGSSILWVVGVPNISLRFCKKKYSGGAASLAAPFCWVRLKNLRKFETAKSGVFEALNFAGNNFLGNCPVLSQPGLVQAQPGSSLPRGG